MVWGEWSGARPGSQIFRAVLASLAGLIVGLGPWSAASAADWQATLRLFHTGQYRDCARIAGEAIAKGEYAEPWRILKIEAEIAVGDYEAAIETFVSALRRYSGSVRLRWLGSRLFRAAGRTRDADRLDQEIAALAQRSPWAYSDSANRVAVGRFLLTQGVDARKVLELFFDRAKQRDPKLAEAYLAAGDLALEKHDYQLAAKEYQKAAELEPENPDAQLGLAQAYRGSSPAEAERALQQALAINPGHVPSLLLLAEQQIDAERYGEAQQLIEQALEVNPESPDAWALRAVIAHLQSRHDEEALWRRVALGWWPLNPRVDWLIGRKLSQHYRFREGAERQRRALDMNPQYAPARFQLAQDLLRLGEEAEGWKLATEVSDADGYNVVAHNLVQLQARIDGYETLSADRLLVRMEAREAKVYGQQVIELLERARDTLCAKYRYELTEPVLVELFPAQQDFAIRTFGLPGGEGFLGVCFGRVITANSPGAQGATPANWQAVLWHEFCHVVTLRKTGNKLPRWFSEGLSVYEERLANPSWGERLTPQYRQMMLGEELTQVSQLNTAFLRPKSPQHLQFAYYEAALVMEYLVEQFGFEIIPRILDDLQGGFLLDDSLARHALPLEQLDAQFAAYARQRAEQFAPGIDWSRPEPLVVADAAALAEWAAEHPQSYFVQRERAEKLLRDEQWQAARDVLEPLLAQGPDIVGSDSPYPLLAAACRGLGDRAGERRAWQALVERDGDALAACERLIELAAEAHDWEAMLANAERAFAIHPLRPTVLRALAEAAEHLGNRDQALAAYQALLTLDPLDPADLHFRVARLMHELGQDAPARRHVLQALEEAPRFRAAQELLLELVGKNPPAEPPSPMETQP